jgi:hypothetical protein
MGTGRCGLCNADDSGSDNNPTDILLVEKNGINDMTRVCMRCMCGIMFNKVETSNNTKPSVSITGFPSEEEAIVYDVVEG